MHPLVDLQVLLWSVWVGGMGGLCLGWASLRGFWNGSARGRVHQPLRSRWLWGVLAPPHSPAAPAWRPGLGHFKHEKCQSVPSSALGGGAARVRPALLSLVGRPGSGQPVKRANPPHAEIIALRPPWQPPPPAELTALVLWGTLLSPGPSPELNELFVGMSG